MTYEDSFGVMFLCELFLKFELQLGTACEIKILKRKKLRSLKLWYCFPHTYASFPTKNQNNWLRESKVRPFTPRFQVTFEKGGVCQCIGFSL